MKYEFKQIELDTYKLIYTDKDNKEVEKEFKRTIEMAEMLEGIPFNAEIELNSNLSKLGKTKDDFIVKTKTKDGKISYNEANYNNLKETYINMVAAKTTEDIVKLCFGMGLVDLFKDMGIDMNNTTIENQRQAELFGQKFALIIAGEKKETPSEK